MELAWLIPLLPFAAFAIIGILTIRQAELSSFITIAAIAASCAISWMLFFRTLAGETYEAQIPWLALSTRDALTFGIRVDPLAAVMLVVVTTVSLLVQIYSRGYLYEPAEEAHAGEGHPEANPALDEGHGVAAPHATAAAIADSGHGDSSHDRDRAAAPAVHAEHHGPPPPLVRDPGFARYFAYMALFTASMLGL